MDLDRLLDNTVKIQSIPAPTFDESRRALFLQEVMQEAGAEDVELDHLGNLYARVPGGNARPVVICAHLDSVMPPLESGPAKNNGKRLEGPGVGDNAVALAALIELAHDLRDRATPGDVWLVANVGEEGLGNLRGMRAVVSRFGAEVSAYIIIEGMALGYVFHRGLPVLRLRLSVQTRGGHSWIHAGRSSAIHILLELGDAIARLPLPQEPRTTLNIGRIEGGISVNSIADTAALELDLRSESEAALQALESSVRSLLDDLKPGNARIQLEQIGHRPGGALPREHPLVKAGIQAYRDEGEKSVRLEVASTDASFPLSLGLPAICVGLTRGGEAHSVREYIEIDPLPRGYTALLRLIQAAFRLGPE